MVSCGGVGDGGVGSSGRGMGHAITRDGVGRHARLGPQTFRKALVFGVMAFVVLAFGGILSEGVCVYEGELRQDKDMEGYGYMCVPLQLLALS
jgi:hypothetical protein